MSRNGDACPLGSSLPRRNCKIKTCMYFSLKDNRCAHSELHESEDGELIREHKNMDKRTFQQEMRSAQDKAHKVLVLDGYIGWLMDNHSRKARMLTADQSVELSRLLEGTIVQRLPHYLPVNMVPVLLDDDLLEEFFEVKELKSVGLAELLFDVPTDSLRAIFG